jgi:glycosyltransferase involved in cell wall biosynthesis
MAVKPSDYDLMLLPRHRPMPYNDKEMFAGIFDKVEEIGVSIQGQSDLIDLVRVLKTKQCVVLEYDDDYFTDSRDLGYEYSELLRALVKEVDAITVSTEHLRNVVQKYAQGVPIYILPNCVVWSEWQDHERWELWPEDYVVLGLTGSPTHNEDWKVLETVLPEVMERHGNVALVMGGFEPDYLSELKVKYPDRVALSGVLDYMDYPGLIRQADIVLCPVVPDDEFNKSKSAIKAIEGLAAGRTLPDGTMGGAVPITSNLYYRVTGGNKRGLTVEHTADAWLGGLTTLIEDQQMRMRFSKKGYAWVRNHHDIDRKWGLWWDAYRTIFRRKRR